MGLLDAFRLGQAVEVLEARQETAFAIDAESMPSEVFGFELVPETVTVAPRIDRKRAMSVPAVKRCRDLICTSLGGLPLHLYDAQGQRLPSSLFSQPEPDQPRSVTMTRTFEDLLFEKRAWWRITERDWRGWPTSVRRLDARSVQVKRDQRVYVARDGNPQGNSWEWIADRDLVRFESPTDGLLVAGARAIRTLLTLDDAARRYAEGSPMLDFFTPADDVDLDADDVRSALDDFARARRERSTGYVGAAMKYNVAGWDPEKLQLHDARQHAVLEVARLCGVDAEDVGVSTTTRTYQNGESRRQALIDFTLSPYATAVQDVLGMGHVTPRGQVARFDFDAFLRPDPKSRYEAYEAGLRVGATTRERIAQAEGLPVEQVQPDNVTALPAPAEEAV